MKKMNKTGTDFEKLAAMNDEDIDYSDIPALSEEFLAAAKWVVEMPKDETDNAAALSDRYMAQGEVFTKYKQSNYITQR